MEIIIKDLATGEVIGTLDSIPEFKPDLQDSEVIGGIDLANGSSFTAEFKLNWLDILLLMPSYCLTNNFLKYHGRPMLRRKHLRGGAASCYLGRIKSLSQRKQRQS